MDLIHFLIDFILHIDVHLAELVAEYGILGIRDFILDSVLRNWPGGHAVPAGDSLLFAAGALSALPTNDLNVHLMVLLMVIAAIVGDALNLHNWPGCLAKSSSVIPIRKFSAAATWIRPIASTNATAVRPSSWPVSVPIVRTFAPFVAGMGHMSHRHFAMYNVVGALLWVLLFTYAGYLFGDLPIVQENLKLLIVAIIVLSVLPGVIEAIRHSGRRRNRRNNAATIFGRYAAARRVKCERFDHFFIPCYGML